MKRIRRKRLKEGWMRPFGEAEWHYFGLDGRTLCGTLAAFKPAGLVRYKEASPDICQACLEILWGRNPKGNSVCDTQGP